ncbi:hypothetical protein RI367_005585 [Sorochytrium milnesiophthora]
MPFGVTSVLTPSTAYNVVFFGLGLGLLALHTVNFVSVRKVYQQKSLSPWLTRASVASVVWGLIGAVEVVVVDIVELITHVIPLGGPGLFFMLCSILQFYFQAIVILQRVHMVNAYKVDTDVITFSELITKRWPELLYTVGLAAVLIVGLSPQSSFQLIAAAGLLWLLCIIFMDFFLSYYTLSKVHKMLNTKQSVLSWAVSSLRAKPEGTAAAAAAASLPARLSLARPSSANPSLARPSSAHPSLARPSSANPSLSRPASNRPSSAGSEEAAIAKSKNNHTARRLVKTWILVMAAITCSIVIYILSWLSTNSTLYGPLTRLSLICMALWQRGTLLHLDAVKHIILANRAGKRFLGRATATGIQENSVAEAPVETSGVKASPSAEPLKPPANDSASQPPEK